MSRDEDQLSPDALRVLASLPRTLDGDSDTEERVVARLRQEGRLRPPRRSANARWMLIAAGILIFFAGLGVGRSTDPDVLESLATETALSDEEGSRLMQRVGSLYIRSLNAYLGATAVQPARLDVARQSVLAAAQALERSDANRELAAVLSRALRPGGGSTQTIIWF